MSIVSQLSDYNKSIDMDLRLNMNGNIIKNIPEIPTEEDDAVSKKYVDDLFGTALQTTLKYNIEENLFSGIIYGSITSLNNANMNVELFPRVDFQYHAYGITNLDFSTLGIGSEYKIKQYYTIEFDGGLDKNHHIIGQILLRLKDPDTFALREEVLLSELDKQPISIPYIETNFMGNARNMFSYEITLRRTETNKFSAFLTTETFSSSTQMEGQSLEVIDNLFTENSYKCMHDPVEFMVSMSKFSRYVEVNLKIPQESDNQVFTIYPYGYTEVLQTRKPFS